MIYSEIEQFHELTVLVIKADHPVKLSADVIMSLDGEIKELEEAIVRYRDLLNDYDKLLRSIMGSRKGSIGTIDNVYLTQLNRKNIDALYKKLLKEAK